MIDDHESVTIEDFRGIFATGDPEAVPKEYCRDCLNLDWDYKKFRRRDGFLVDTITTFGINRIQEYNRVGEAPRLLILDTTGKLWDSAIGFVTPILNIAAMIDFSLVVLFNRAYITPHDRNRGLPGESVYVYQGSGLARAAGGLPPSGFTLTTTTSAASGVIGVGDRLFAVAFETDTGYITAPGPAIFTRYSAPGSKAVDFSNVPIGPAGTVARWIISSTQLLTTFDGNQLDVAYFFIPEGRIAGNVVTTLAGVSFYDSELVSSADYLFDQLSTIPAGVGIGAYKGSLVVWGSNASDRTIYVSKAGQPESIDGVNDIIQVRDDGGGGVKNCVEFRNNLFIHKQQRTYVTQSNNDDPAFWIVDPHDQSVGTDCFGIGRILDETGNLLDFYIIADRTALKLFNGTFNIELSYNQKDLWDRINKACFDQVQVQIDPLKKLIYVSAPLDDATSPSHLFNIDYSEGLAPDKVKWGIWTFPKAPKSIVVDVNFTTKQSIFKFASSNNNVHKQSSLANDDFGTAIPYFWHSYLVPFSSGDGFCQYVAARVRARGVGTFQLTIYGLDDVNPQSPATPTLNMSPGKLIQYKFNYDATRASFKFAGGFNNGDTVIVNRVKIYGSELWSEDPNP